MADIAGQVEEILDRYRIRRPPVPVDQIAKKLGIILCHLPAGAEDDISGAIVRKENHVVIAVNPAHHRNRQRFTIAHELGHYCLHESHVYEHVDQKFSVAWRKTDSSGGVDWFEIEANRFAAELLIPTKLLMKDVDSLSEIDKRTIVLLASRYEVSKDAMRFRLTNLGLIGLIQGSE